MATERLEVWLKMPGPSFTPEPRRDRSPLALYLPNVHLQIRELTNIHHLTQSGTANHPLGPPPARTLSTPPAATATAQLATKHRLSYSTVTCSTVIVPVSIAIRPHHESGEQAVHTLTTGRVTTSAQSAKIADILLPIDGTIPVSPAPCRSPYRVRSTSPSIPLVAALTAVRGAQGFRS
jgi:hypothetical protein